MTPRRGGAASIIAIAYALPGRVVTNDELAAAHPEWDMATVALKTGVLERRVADDETALSLATSAATELIAANPDARDADAILFCTQTPDQVMPPNSALLHEQIGLGEDVLAYDFTLACSGFVIGLAQAQGLIAAGLASSILLVTGDTYSRLIDPDDRGPATLFGDGAAVTWIRAGERGLVDVITATAGRDHRSFTVPRGTPYVRMDGLRVLSWVQTHVPRQVLALLERNGCTVDDVDLFVFHQASRIALDALERALRIPAGRSYSNLERVGNTVSASIPIALRDAMDQGRAKPGDRVVLCGFGVGMSWATALVEL